MIFTIVRERSLAVYHLHMGGPDADALEVRALMSPRYGSKLRGMGVVFVPAVEDADVVLLTGLLLTRNLDAVLAELARLPTPSVLVAAGDCAINGGMWAKGEMPGLSPQPLGHYADVPIVVPGNPPTPQAIITGLATAAKALAQPEERLVGWHDE